MAISRIPFEPLGEHVERHVAPNPGAYGSRAARRGGSYSAFVPAFIAERPFPLGGEASAAMAEATRALARLAGASAGLASLDALVRNVVRAESVASSRIEGVNVSQQRLARVAQSGRSGRASDPTALEVLGNVAAMEQAIAIGAAGGGFTVADIKAIHRTLLQFTADSAIAGVVRTKQDWIGGNDYSPIGADYVPPPPENVPDLLDDLCRFVERNDLAPVAQAAIAHAQFENIHPFADGNGRVGRALIYTVLRRRGETDGFIPPLSLVLAQIPKAYVGGLGAYSQGNVDLWCARFAAATTRAAEQAQWLANAIDDQEIEWLERLGHPRSDAAVRQILRELPAHPVIDAGVAEALTGKSHTAVNNALNQLEVTGILQPLNEKRWGRSWEARELLDLATAFEERVGGVG